MISAHYSLVRYTPDAARGEQLNIGILAWTDHRLAFDLDSAAVDRVIRENPHLATDALAGLRDQLRSELAVDQGDASAAAQAWLSFQHGFPVTATEPRHTTVTDDSQAALVETVDRLVTRIVRPRRRSGGGAGPGHALEQRLRPLIRSNRILRDHTFRASRSGVARRVDYFANSTANVALDVVSLAVKSADEILRRADAEAFKVEDILAKNDLKIVVYCAVSADDAVREPTATATKIIESVGAVALTSAEEAAGRVFRAVS